MDPRATLSAFRRVSVADQASAALRHAIQQGTLGDPLPGEHHLARELGISRSSLRIALAQLATEGLIQRRKGRRACLKPTRRRPAPPAPPVVCVICPVSRDLLVRNPHPVVMEMRVIFATKGIGWEEVFDAKLDVPQPERQLERLVTGRRHVCWLLLACSAPIQRWFAQAGVPAFVVGSCVPGVELPSIDADYRAVGWHAAGAILQHGHRHLGLVHFRRPLAGDLNLIEGVLGYLAQAAPQTIVTRILVDADLANLPARIRQLAATRQRPTVLLCVRPGFTLVAMIQLLRCGLRIPEDISIVSRDSHPLLDDCLPEVTRYSGVSLRQANRAVRVAQALLAGHPVPPRPSLVFPAFIAGRTLAAARLS